MSVTAAKWIDSSAKLQFRFFLNLFSCLLTRNLSRRNNVSRAGLKTLLNFRRNGNRQWILITFHVYSRYLAATRDVHSTATGCKWLNFRLTTIMQRNQSTHTACTDTASSNRKSKWEVCRHAKRQRVEKVLDYVSCFPLRFFCVTAAFRCFTTEQSFEASIFVNVTHLILKGGDSRLKLLSFEIFVVLGQIEANFHYFTSYLHSAVVLRNETHQMMK